MSCYAEILTVINGTFLWTKCTCARLAVLLHGFSVPEQDSSVLDREHRVLELGHRVLVREQPYLSMCSVYLSMCSMYLSVCIRTLAYVAVPERGESVRFRTVVCRGILEKYIPMAK